MVDNKSDRFHLDPNQVRKVELCHEPPGRESVRVTVEYVTSEVRVLTVHKSLLAAVLEQLAVLSGEQKLTPLSSNF
jgi:hypothetical protein